MSTRITTLCVVLLLGLVGPAMAQIFMRVEGIPGDARDARHQNEIVLTGYTFNIAQAGTPGAGGGAGAGRVTLSPIIVTKPIDSSSPRLALAASNGQHIPQVIITVLRAGGREPMEYLHYTLNDVTIANFAQENTPAGTPVETVGLTYGAISMEYMPQQPDGSTGAPIRMNWDMRRNAPG